METLGLRGYIAKRSLNTIILVLFVINLNFLIFEVMPGQQSSIQALAGNPALGANEALYDKQIEIYGLNKTLGERWLIYFRNMLTFSFGISFETLHPVQYDMIQSGRLVNTLVLLGASTILAMIIGIMLGVVAAHKRGGIYDTANVVSSLTTYSLPSFWIGIVLILIFHGALGWFPVGGTQPFGWIAQGPGSFAEWLIERLRYAFLPVLTLTLFSYGGFLLLTRATMLETLSDDYIVTARAKGLSERTVLFKHALKNASLPIVTSAGLSFGFILTGAIITETVFSWDGLGRWIFQAIGAKDFPVLQAMFYIVALTVIIANFISDLLLGVLDPRIRYD